MPKVLKTDGMNKCIGCFTCMLTCSAVNRQNHSISKSSIKIKTSGGLQGRFLSIVCIGCRGERPCAEACPSGALELRNGGGVLVNTKKCIGCASCVSACIIGAIHMDEETNNPIICKHCGVCTRFCPHNCLRMEDVENDL